MPRVFSGFGIIRLQRQGPVRAVQRFVQPSQFVQHQGALGPGGDIVRLDRQRAGRSWPAPRLAGLARLQHIAVVGQNFRRLGPQASAPCPSAPALRCCGPAGRAPRPACDGRCGSRGCAAINCRYSRSASASLPVWWKAIAWLRRACGSMTVLDSKWFFPASRRRPSLAKWPARRAAARDKLRDCVSIGRRSRHRANRRFWLLSRYALFALAKRWNLIRCKAPSQ